MEYITFTNAAERLHKSKATIYRYIKQGLLTPYYSGVSRHYPMFDASEVHALLEFNPNDPAKPMKLKDAVKHRDGYICAICLYAGPALNVHHIITVENGGPDEPENLITLCTMCHHNIHQNSEHSFARLRKKGHEHATSSIVEWLLSAFTRSL